MITHQQARHFREIGYLLFENVIEPALIDQLHAYVECEFQHMRASSPDGALTSKCYRLYEKNPALMSALIAHEGIVSRLTGLLGPNIVFVTNRHNQAALNLPHMTDTRLHRDVLQWTRNVVTVVVYLEDSTISNGCTWIVPGSHYLPLVGVPQAGGGGTWMGEHEEFQDMLNQAVPVTVSRGGLLIFDSLLFHATGPNTSATGRASIVLGYRSVDELDHFPDRGREILVAGSWIYRGNDRIK